MKGPIPLASHWPQQLSVVDLRDNPLGVDQSVTTSLDFPPSVDFLELSNTSLQGLMVSSRPFIAKFVDLTENSLGCPIPGVGADSIVVGTCNPNWVRYKRNLLFGSSSAIVVGILVLLLRERVIRASKLSEFRLRLLRSLAIWVFAVLDLAGDTILNLDIISYINAKPPCSMITQREFFSNILPNQFFYTTDGTPFPKPDLYDNFAQYVELVEASIRLPKTNIRYLEDLCGKTQGECQFTDQLFCRNIAHSPHEAFGLFVVAALCVYVVKEALKFCGLLFLACRRRRVAERGAEPKDLRIGYFASKSVLSPVFFLLLGPKYFSEVALHDADCMDAFLEVLYEGIEVIPQLYISAYFISVTRSELSTLNFVSVSLSTFGMLWLLGKTLARMLAMCRKRRTVLGARVVEDFGLGPARLSKRLLEIQS